MPQPEPATVPLTLSLSPAAARALFSHEPSVALLEAVLRQIASGPPPPDPPPILHTTLVDPHLLQEAQQAAAERGTPLADAIEQLLLLQPVLLYPARIARLLDVEQSTLDRALIKHDNAPGPANPEADGKHQYDVHAVFAWWPTRRRGGRPANPVPKPS